MSKRRLYIRIRGAVIGPFDFGQLKSLRDRGQFRKFHEVSEDRVKWVPASTVTELFEGAEPAPGRFVAAYPTVDDAPYPLKPDPVEKPAATPRPAAEEWHYVGSAGQPQGPVARDRLLSLYQQGAITPTTLVWKEGLGNWIPITAPETGLGLVAPRRGGLARHWWIVLAAVAGCLLVGGLVFAAYKLWPRNPVIGNIVNRDKDLSSALGLVVCGAKVTLPTGDQKEIATTVGSCFAVSADGYLLTNKHVVEDVWKNLHAELFWEKVKKEKLIVVKPSVWVFIQHKKFPAQIEHVSDNYDLAILKIDRQGPCFALSLATDLPRGKPVSACGYPDLARAPFPGDEEKLDKLIRESQPERVEGSFKDRDFEFTMTNGAISRVVAQHKGETWIQHNATISPGSSGGPLIVEDGTVIGVNTLGLREAGIFTSLALPQLREEIDKHVPRVVWK